MKELPVRRFATKAAWETWLSKHHENSPGLWLEFAKKGSRTMTVPDDLRLQLEAHPRARRFFEQLDSQNRYAILYRLHDARKPETRERRLAKFIDMLEAGETLYPS
jgi:uncharacterized protein YdeI (YjbR/CyaY-like superfamily)